MHIGDSDGKVVAAKSKVAPVRHLTIPLLEICGALLLAQLLYLVKEVFDIPLSDCCACIDSTIVLNWLVGSSHRLKTHVGNSVSHIVELIPPDCWSLSVESRIQQIVLHEDCSLRSWLVLTSMYGEWT